MKIIKNLDLFNKTENQYKLLEKITLSPTFYVAYSEYRNLADEINKIDNIENNEKDENKFSFDEFYDSFFGYITLRVVPLISFLEKNKEILFKKLPGNDTSYFNNLIYHFSKLAKMDGDTRFNYWFIKTDELFNNFLDQIETTPKGNKLFIETEIMNVMHELLKFIQLKKIEKELKTSSLLAIHENDIHTLKIKMDKYIKENPRKDLDFSLKYKGDVEINNIYHEQDKTKEELMAPIHTFQTKLRNLYIPKTPILNKEDNVFYITKNGDDFYYKGKYLNFSKNNDYYKVFCALYALLPEGGEVRYKEIINEIKSRIPEVKSRNDPKMRKFIQANLTDKNNGFMRYANIPNTEDNGKPLIKIIRGSGVRFNNQAR